MAYRYWAVGDCHWGFHDPRNGLRVRPIAQNRTEYQQASGEAFRLSSRLDRPLLHMVSMGLSLRKVALPSDWDAQGSAQMPKWQHLHAERGMFDKVYNLWPTEPQVKQIHPCHALAPSPMYQLDSPILCRCTH